LVRQSNGCEFGSFQPNGLLVGQRDLSSLQDLQKLCQQHLVRGNNGFET